MPDQSVDQADRVPHLLYVQNVNGCRKPLSRLVIFQYHVEKIKINATIMTEKYPNFK